MENLGNSEDTITLSAVDEYGWDLSLSKNSVTLLPGEFTYILLNLTTQSNIANQIKVYAKSTSYPLKSSYCVVKYKPNFKPTFITLKFNTENELEIKAPDYLKISDFWETNGEKRVIIAFDPKIPDSEIRAFHFSITDKDTGETAEIPFRLQDCEIISTNFDVSLHGYRFHNWGDLWPIWDRAVQGHCHGMSETSMLFFEEVYNLKEFANYANFAYEAEKEDVEEVIKAHQRTNDFIQTLKILFGFLGTVNEQEEYNKLKEGINSGKPMLLTFQQSLLAVHVVVAYKIIEIEDYAFILCYDNNNPYRESYIDFGKSFTYFKLDKKTWNL